MSSNILTPMSRSLLCLAHIFSVCTQRDETNSDVEVFKASKARKYHAREQRRLQAQNQPACPGCNLCSQTQTPEMKAAAVAGNTIKGCACFSGDIAILERDIAAFISSQDIHYHASRLVYWTHGCIMVSRNGTVITYKSRHAE
ncbi:hypothetical protein BJ878DRAFT_484205 [Calycina marina]|uniref:Secreted protein n=1 Tax=Calycina marina TaxID=1763456 RepID=A0A9P8CCA0_9HELO|nr:hypothetical protein BJ878DRAFT_484205 [Calycina marina]